MSTLSQILDELRNEILHPELMSAMVDYAHLTIRELHYDQDMAQSYPDDLVEEVLTATSDDGFLYSFARPQRFMKMEAVYYQNRGLYAVDRSPASARAFVEEINGDVFYYRTGAGLAFSGYGGTGAVIQLAYYEIPKRLLYYPTATRPATWDEESETWSYLPAYDVDDTTRSNALALSTNWILFRHKEVVKEGIRAKTYKRLNDDRAKICFSAYNALKPIVFAEAKDFTPRYER